MINMQKVIAKISKLAPNTDALDWDNSGLQVGEYNLNVNKIMVTMDLNLAVLDEAINKKIDMIISHHPLIFNSLKSIHDQTKTGKIIIKAIKNNIAIYSTHTNMDIADGGLNDYLTRLLLIENTELLSKEKEYKVYKLAVYVPEKDADKLRQALFDKGAGNIGNYSNTSFNITGEGTFKPGENTDPYLGKKGSTEHVKEIKIETIVKESKIDNVIKQMLKTHPYQEVAYDIYQLPLQSKYKGIGRIGNLKESMVLKDYCEIVKQKLNITNLKVSGDLDSEIKKVAICSGAGTDYISTAKTQGADLFITGDIKFHEAQLAQDYGLNLIDANHFNTEIIFIDLIADYLEELCSKENYEVDIIKSETNTNPWIDL
ncbi:MAG: Nif3-like dinuclear metal center hexameric protein [Halanaerobiales bacterium]|nr:Nif3-like dinuclear metal center hexameric protein [Halanaerobiales bacterium]